MRGLTKIEKKFIHDWHKEMSHRKMSDMLFVPVSLIEDYCKENNLKTPASRIGKLTDRSIKHREKFIQDNYKTMSHESIAKKLGVATQTVSNYCSKNKLYKRKINNN